jgi:hypothetical protein
LKYINYFKEGKIRCKMGIKIVAYDIGDKGYLAGREVRRKMTEKGLMVYFEDAVRISREKVPQGSKNLSTLLFIQYVSMKHENEHFLASEFTNPEPVRFEVDGAE